ncbi:hypothetical protein [Anseongella ginsenosidimutans]|nr:hypothetical protein [Anseongella ginsenosidimutans]QEC52121.1 hypothetical protein FRZ59_07090 [Anseongella ginsenosidimutans]
MLSTAVSCKKDDILLTKETYTELTIKYENFPDFSFAGYEQSEEAIPLVPVKIVIEAGEGDDAGLIQDAIDTVSNLPVINGFRGAVLLKAGTYEVGQTIYIRTNGVVLRGEGQGEAGTIIMATAKPRELGLTKVSEFQQYNLIEIEGSADPIELSGGAVIAADRLHVGARSIPVNTASDLRKGDHIGVVKTPDQNWISALGMDQYGWTPEQYTTIHRRKIAQIKDNVIVLDIPLVDQIQKSLGGGNIVKLSLPKRVSNSGVENLRLISIADSEFELDENRVWTAVRLSRTVNCWVRNITAVNFIFTCVSIGRESDFNTIQDCAMLDPTGQTIGDRKYAFLIEGGGGMGNLFQRCYSKGGRHDFATSSKVTGPNVFLDCYAIDTHNDTGPHHRWATGILYDNIYAGRITARNRRELGGGHGWAGAQNMFWNCKATEGFQIESPPNAINWCIGCRGEKNGNAYWASWSIPVKPRSFFLEQLKNRLGPAAVAAVTVPAQLGDTPIWSELEKWAGGKDAMAKVE